MPRSTPRRWTLTEFLQRIGRNLTARPPARAPEVLAKIAEWAGVNRRTRQPIRPIVRVKKFGRPTANPKVSGPRVLSAVLDRISMRIRGDVFFLRKFGRPTARPLIRPVEFIRARFAYGLRRTKAKFIRAIKSTIVVFQVFPRDIRVLLTRRRTPKTITRRTRTFGRPTARPPIRRAVFLRTRFAYGLRRVRAKFLKPIRSTIVVFQVFPKRIKALLTRRRTPRTITRRTRVFGRPTTRPPIRRIRFVRTRFSYGLRRTRTTFLGSFGGPSSILNPLYHVRPLPFSRIVQENYSVGD